MVMMDGHYSEDHLQQLWHRIDTLHLSYLETEESPEKLDTRIKLESCIRDFLCAAAPNQKFYNPETMEVLDRSASSKPDFSGYKAATGFNTIQMYAGNILSQPWRKEYRQIKLYSGFYKHNVEANLLGAESLFKAMGYKYIGNGVLVLEGPICPDKASAVSRDCLVAYVECQILKTIWEGLSPYLDISWFDVLELRKKFISSPERTVRTIKCQLNQKKYQEPVKNGYPSTVEYVQPQPKAVVQVPPSYYPISYNTAPVYNDHVNSLPTHKYSYEMNGCCPAMMHPAISNATYTYPVSTAMIPELVPEHYNRYCCSDPYIAPKQCMMHNYNNSYQAPTADLIRFNSQNDLIDNVNHSRLPKENPLQRTNNMVGDTSTRKVSEEVHTDSTDNAEKRSQFEDWGYVYRDLASQGYSKDLGERGNILSSVTNTKQNSQVNSDLYMNHNDAMNHSEVDGSLPTVKYNQTEKELKSTKPLKVTEKQNEETQYKSINKKSPGKTLAVNTLKNKSSQSKRNLTEEAAASKSVLLDAVKAKEGNVTTNQAKEVTKNNTRWECKTCTFLNNSTKDVCEMCSKSKSVVIQPIEIGGTQCSICTLVNPKDCKNCTACDSNLENSPTYI